MATDKKITLRLKCETNKNCLDAKSEDGHILLNPKICLSCDLGQVEVLEIVNYVEEKSPEEKPEEKPKFAPKEEAETTDTGLESS